MCNEKEYKRNKMKKVQILMSTYNGSKYLRVQLDSIIHQSYSELDLLIRDDGSTDGTQEILEEYALKYNWIHWYQGENIGVQKSFFHLIQNADLSASYFSFADQDDKWMVDKIARAVTIIQKLEQSNQKAVLYCSDKCIVDEQLNPIDVTVSRPVRKITFGNALVQDMCTGCTAVMNRELLEMIRTHMPQNIDSIIMHDWWFYLAGTCFGTVYYDKIPYIWYRQHGKNTSGAMLNRKSLLKYRITQLLKPRGEIYRQVLEFERSFHISTQQQKLIEKIKQSKCSFKGKLLLALDFSIFRQKRTDDFIYRCITIIGKL